MIREITSLSNNPARPEPLSEEAAYLAAPGTLTVCEPDPIAEPVATKRRKRTCRPAAGGRRAATPLARPAFPSWARVDASRRTDEETLGEGRGGREDRDAGGLEAQKSTAAAKAAFLAGAALAVLDPLVRDEAASFRGCWLARLALQAAAASARNLGRGEEEAALRDAFYLRPPGGDPGPAGRLLVAFRIVVGRRPVHIFGADAAAKVLGELGFPSHSLLDGSEESEQARPALTETFDAAAALAKSDRPAIIAASDAAPIACRDLAPNGRRAGAIFALLLADAVLTLRLGWPVLVPLLSTSKEAGQACHCALRTGQNFDGAQMGRLDEALFESFCLGITKAAARAHDLFFDLARRAERLEAALPRLRAKGAAGAVEKILAEDAVTAAMRPGNLSDRAARRLFDRLVALGALRELSGRPAFRLYGL